MPVALVRPEDLVRVVSVDSHTERSPQYARVLATVHTSGERSLIQLKESGLQITDSHPIRINGQFVKPRDVTHKIVTSCSLVVNFVLDRPRVLLLVDGIECVTYGHGIEAAFHPFYSSQEVVNVVMALPRDQQGRIHVSG